MDDEHVPSSWVDSTLRRVSASECYDRRCQTVETRARRASLTPTGQTHTRERKRDDHVHHHTMSLDGFIAGPDDSMDWVFGFGEATSLADETMDRIGAILAGRRWYELAIERW